MPNCLRGILLNLALLICLHHASVFVSCQPRDTVAVVNQSVFFNCSTVTPKIVWYYYTVGSDEAPGGDVVYRSGSVFAKYRTDFRVDEYGINGTHFCNLIINNMKESFAGKYVCRDNNGVGVTSSAQLIVIDSDPICRPNSEPVRIIGLNDCGLEPEQMELSCSVSFIGNSAPILKWTADGIQVQDVLNATNEISNNRVTYNVTLSSGNYIHDTEYMCQAMQSIGKEQLCTVDIRVLYALNTTIKIDKLVGDEVNCSVNTSSHSCHYEWIKLDDKGSSTVSNSSVLKIKNSGLHQCRATCDLLDKKCLIFGTTVNASESPMGTNPKDGLSRGAVAGIVIGILILVFLVCLVFFCCIRRRRPRVLKNESLFKPLTAKERNNSKKAIAGMAIYKEELFVVFEGSSTIEVFHVITFAFQDSFVIRDFSRPLDIVSCPAKDWLFVYALGKDSSGEIFVMDRNGSLLRSWETSEGIGCLSVTLDSNVILSVFNSCLLKVYASDGLHSRDVKLPSNIQPFHAIRFTEDEFLVSYKEKNQTIHGICFANSNGELIRNISKELSFPRYLSLISDSECLIADSMKSRILLVTQAFEIINIFSIANGLIRPVKICFDYSTGRRLFVADNGDRNPRVMIFEYCRHASA